MVLLILMEYRDREMDMLYFIPECIELNEISN